MFSLRDARLQKASEAKTGHLLYCAEPEGAFVLRVEVFGDNEAEKIGLLYLSGLGKEILGPTVYNDSGDIRCIDIGEAIFAWAPGPNAIQDSRRSSASGSLIVRSDGLSLCAFVNPRIKQVAWWNVSSGQMLRPQSNEIFISDWHVGALDVDGKFCKVFSMLTS